MYSGAVYIYHGSRNGIKKTPVQSIYPSKLGNSLGGKFVEIIFSYDGKFLISSHEVQYSVQRNFTVQLVFMALH